MTTHAVGGSEYIFDSASDQGRQQVDYLSTVFDPITTGFLADLDVRRGARCLELGAGSGSIARWLAEQVGPQGQVVAVDKDIEQLELPPQVEVHRHDIRDGLPVDGPFDLIHARLLLLHLPDRLRVLQELVDVLAPGGWLVLGDSPDRPQEVLAAPRPADAELADRLVHIALVCGEAAGLSLQWAYDAEREMVAAGLEDIRGSEYSPLMRGGDPCALLMSSYISQMAGLLTGAGVTEADIERFHALMRDPRFRAWPHLRMITTAGRKPQGTAHPPAVR